MIENDKLKVRSKPLLSELKGYVAAGASFQAKPGSTDDLVSATILVLRVINVMKDWNPDVYESFTQVDHNEEYEAPMPIFVSSNY